MVGVQVAGGQAIRDNLIATLADYITCRVVKVCNTFRVLA